MTMKEEKQPLLDKEVPDSDQQSVLQWRHGALIPCVFLVLFGTSMYSYVLNEWTQNTIKLDYFPNASSTKDNACSDLNKSDAAYQKYQHVQQLSASWTMAFTLAEYIPTLLVQLALPSYSDTYGRKFLFISTIAGLVIKAVTITLTIHFSESFWYIIGVNIVEGLLGGSFGFFSAIFSFTADLTSSSHRSTAIVIVEATAMIGYIIGGYLVGYFIETLKLGFYNTSLISTSVLGLGLVLVFIIPESLPKNKRTARKPILATMKRMFDFYVSSEFKGKRILYILLLLAFLCFSISGFNRSTMETLYFLGQPFCWGPSKIGLFSLSRHGAQCVLGLGSVKLLQKLLSDEVVSILSTMSNTVSLIVEAFALSSLMIYMVPVTGMFSFLVIPMIRGMMSSMTSPDRQGAVFAGISLIEGVSNILGSLSQNEIYSFTLSFMNGFVFLVMAFFSVITTCLLLAYKCIKPKDQITIHIQSKDGSPDC